MLSYKAFVFVFCFFKETKMGVSKYFIQDVFQVETETGRHIDTHAHRHGEPPI